MTKAPLILGFDTSGPWCSAVVLQGDTVLADAYEEMGRGQAEHLFPVLEDLLKRAGASWQDLDAIGVGIGPGNFTGIRIAVSSARGLALSLSIPAVGVSLLEAAGFGQNTATLACLAAPRGHLYVQGYRTAADIPAQFLAMEGVNPDWAEPDLVCVGSAAEDVASRLNSPVVPALFAPGSAVARIAAQKWQSNPKRPAPMYLKAADAAPPRDPAPVILS